jgi:hypothetical protein
MPPVLDGVSHVKVISNGLVTSATRFRGAVDRLMAVLLTLLLNGEYPAVLLVLNLKWYKVPCTRSGWDIVWLIADPARVIVLTLLKAELVSMSMSKATS